KTWKNIKKEVEGFAKSAEVKNLQKNVTSFIKKAQKEIKGVVGLKQWLMEKEQQQRVIESFCRHLCGYALGRGVLVTDQPLLERMEKALHENEQRPLAAIQILINSPQFRQYRNQEFK
ncbi:MAG: DUF1585 domain-containing protein, partial [Planctomycetes bacterium]|nr:DUF1585 domain-containing protein [Planctomycetota bacterium]